MINNWNDLTVETIVILVFKQIISNSFKNEITYKLFPYKSYEYPFTWCKQMTGVKLISFHSNTRKHLNVYEKNELRLV